MRPVREASPRGGIFWHTPDWKARHRGLIFCNCSRLSGLAAMWRTILSVLGTTPAGPRPRVIPGHRGFSRLFLHILTSSSIDHAWLRTNAQSRLRVVMTSAPGNLSWPPFFALSPPSSPECSRRLH